MKYVKLNRLYLLKNRKKERKKKAGVLRIQLTFTFSANLPPPLVQRNGPAKRKCHSRLCHRVALRLHYYYCVPLVAV